MAEKTMPRVGVLPALQAWVSKKSQGIKVTAKTTSISLRIVRPTTLGSIEHLKKLLGLGYRSSPSVNVLH